MTPHTPIPAPSRAVNPDAATAGAHRGTTAASIPSQSDAAGFSQLSARVAELQRRADALKGRAGYHAMLERLTMARCAMLRAELDASRN